MAGWMSGIKRTPADIWFSKCIRQRAGWRCEKCGAQHAENSMGLHCSHHHSRRNAGIRLDPLGAESLCYGCHSHYGGTEARRLEALGAEGVALLNELKNDLNRGREYKRASQRELSAHYKAEFVRMVETGSSEFVGFI